MTQNGIEGKEKIALMYISLEHQFLDMYIFNKLKDKDKEKEKCTLRLYISRAAISQHM